MRAHPHKLLRFSALIVLAMAFAAGSVEAASVFGERGPGRYFIDADDAVAHNLFRFPLDADAAHEDRGEEDEDGSRKNRAAQRTPLPDPDTALPTKTLLSRQSAAHLQAGVPLFVLFHCWRSEVS